MGYKLLEVDNLADLDEELNEFAEYHQNKGGQEAHKLITQMWEERKDNPRSGAPNDIIHDEGFDLAFKVILEMLRTKFVPNLINQKQSI